ncbi:MAG: 23S rRNA (adenine(2503)-C(2))-methyltransferase RlmN, partial [Propionibacterium sp.]
MKQLPLVFDSPRKGKPPTHWLDLSKQQREEAVLALGLPKFRANQLSKQLF